MTDRTNAGRTGHPKPRGIDPRGPRFTAGITAVLLLVTVFLGIVGTSTATSFGWFAYQPLSDATFSPLWQALLATRVADPAFWMLLVITLLFLWGVVSPRTAPWGVVFRRLIQPRLSPPLDLEDPRPPRFAQGVGLAVTAAGLVLHLAGVPWSLPIAAALAFMAAFLNAVFGLCLGCQLYLVLQRIGITGRQSPLAGA